MTRVQLLVAISIVVAGCGSGADSGLAEIRSATVQLDASPTGVVADLTWAAGGVCSLPAGVSATFDGQPLKIGAVAGDCAHRAQLTLDTAIDFKVARPTSTLIITDGSTELRAVFQALVGPHGIGGPLGSPPLTPASEVEFMLTPETDSWMGAEKLHWNEFPSGPDDAPAKGTLTGRFKVKIPAGAVAGQKITFSAGQGTGLVTSGVGTCAGLAQCVGRPMIIPDGVTITVR